MRYDRKWVLEETCAESCVTSGIVFWVTSIRNGFLVVRQADYFSSAEAQLRLQRMKCCRVPCDFGILKWLPVLWLAANQEEPFPLLVPQLKSEIVGAILSAFETCQFLWPLLTVAALCVLSPLCASQLLMLVFVDRTSASQRQAGMSPVLFIDLPGLRLALGFRDNVHGIQGCPDTWLNWKSCVISFEME